MGLIIFKLLSGELNQNCSFFKGANIDPLTMLIVDFFEFESIYSNIYGGINPKFDLFCQYKIKMDDFFLEYIENDFISIDFVQKVASANGNQSKSKLNIISNSKISLKNLLITPDSCIQNDIELTSNDGQQEYIGKISFIVKMLRSVDIDSLKLQNKIKPIESSEPSELSEIYENVQQEKKTQTDCEETAAELKAENESCNKSDNQTDDANIDKDDDIDIDELERELEKELESVVV